MKRSIGLRSVLKIKNTKVKIKKIVKKITLKMFNMPFSTVPFSFKEIQQCLLKIGETIIINLGQTIS